MELFKPDFTVDFLKYRKVTGTVSAVLVLLSVISIFVPGPNFGVDFKGGTELEIAFRGEVSAAEVRGIIADLGYQSPQVMAVVGDEKRFLIRLDEVSALAEDHVEQMRAALQTSLGEVQVDEFKVSPGGDKISLRMRGEVSEDQLAEALKQAGAKLRSVNVFGDPQDHRFEALLVGVGDEAVAGLTEKLGDRGPDRDSMRVEWVGPKAGAQLRDAALKSLLWAMALIMGYVAFRFDFRFAPGAVVAMAHDALITVGVFVLLQKQVTLATVAALLTVVGYSINDTIVVYDRIRENMRRATKSSLADVINESTSQTLSRTVVTSLTTLISVTGFFVWGTPMIRDIVFALFIGFVVGTYSSIFVAAPLTEWLDRRYFRPTAPRATRKPAAASSTGSSRSS